VTTDCCTYSGAVDTTNDSDSPNARAPCMSRLKRVFNSRFGSYCLYVCVVILFFGVGQAISSNLTKSQQVWFFLVLGLFFFTVCSVRWGTGRPLLPM
jgi:hypothetical protein